MKSKTDGKPLELFTRGFVISSKWTIRLLFSKSGASDHPALLNERNRSPGSHWAGISRACSRNGWPTPVFRALVLRRPASSCVGSSA